MFFEVTNPFALITSTIRHFTDFTISITSLLYKGISAGVFNTIFTPRLITPLCLIFFTCSIT